MDNTIICSVNCEGLNRSSVFLSSVLKTYKCDFLCLQELWLLDETLYRLGSISTEYMYTAICCCCCMPFSTILVVNPGSPGLESSVLVSS